VSGYPLLVRHIPMKLLAWFGWLVAATAVGALFFLWLRCDDLAARNRTLEAHLRGSPPPNVGGVSDTTKAQAPRAGQETQTSHGSKQATESIAKQISLMKGEWRESYRIASELAKLDPAIVLDVLKGTWNSIASPSDRQQILKAFQLSGNARVLEVLDLGMTDRDSTVREWAAEYLQLYAFVDLSDAQDYASWRDRFLTMPTHEVVRSNAREYLSRLGGLQSSAVDGAAFDATANALRRYAKSADVAKALVESGLSDVLEKWIATGNPSAVKSTLATFAEYPIDEQTQRRVVLPFLERPEFRIDAIGALAHEGNGWAVDVLTPFLKSQDDGELWASARALAAVGDRRVVALMINTIIADGTERTLHGIGQYGLEAVTGVRYDPKRDARWWGQWWQENQARFK